MIKQSILLFLPEDSFKIVINNRMEAQRKGLDMIRC